MKIVSIILLSALLASVSACVVEEPYHHPNHRAGYKIPTTVIIDTDDDHDDYHPQKFCPPGQAKKGRC